MTLLSPGVQVTHTDTSFIIKPQWSKWERTFLLFPKTTITGNSTVGFSWVRTIENHVGEHEDMLGFYLTNDGCGAQYARNKKEIFVQELKGKNNALVV